MEFTKYSTLRAETEAVEATPVFVSGLKKMGANPCKYGDDQFELLDSKKQKNYGRVGDFIVKGADDELFVVPGRVFRQLFNTSVFSAEQKAAAGEVLKQLDAELQAELQRQLLGIVENVVNKKQFQAIMKDFGELKAHFEKKEEAEEEKEESKEEVKEPPQLTPEQEAELEAMDKPLEENKE